MQIGLHLPVLQVAIPLLSAPLCLLLRNGRLAWVFTLTVSWLVLGCAVWLLLQVLAHGTVSYALGNWPAPWGIEYHLDHISAFVLLIVSGISAVVLPFAGKSVAREIPADRVPLFYSLFLLCLTGLLGIVITGDAFNLFVFLEISSLSSYALISQGRSRRALTASFHYLILGTIGATFILIGVGLLYMMTGTLNMQDLAARLPAVANTRTVHTAFAFLIVGISIKLALFPLHLWLPNAYTYAPSVVTAFLAATATKVGVYILLRFVFTIFGEAYAFQIVSIGFILLVLALLAIFSASTMAIFQDNLKRMLAYSSVAQIGYMVLGISFASVTGLTAGILHLFNHALMKGTLFLALGCVVYRMGAANIGNIAGLARSMPLTFAAIVVGGLSLIGVPLTVGFISKWYLLLAAIEAGHVWIAVLVLLGSLLAVVYMWRVIEAAYFKPAPAGFEGVQEAPLSMLIPTWVLVIANLYFGIHTELTVGVARQAAQVLVGAP
jgi:multicomponent Na+:H+ antiporter subunit D